MAKKKSADQGSKRAKADGADTGVPIIYVHGIGHQAAKEKLKREWDLALFGRDMGDRTRMAYWSDVLHGPGEPAAKSTKGRAESAPFAAENLVRGAGVGKASRDDALRLAQALLRNTEVAPTAARTGVGKKVLPLPGFLRRPLARLFLENLVKDTAAYFFKTGVRERVRRRLEDKLPKGKDARAIIVAHSQGTIITLEVLASLKSTLAIPHLLTLGSPLGIREVQDLLDCELAVPKGVAAWRNFADPLDPVAFDKGLSNDFDPAGFIRDSVIFNMKSRQLAGFNPHSAVGYLAHPDVRTRVQDAARVDRRGRFLMARDVAADLAVEDRHSVLIEILEPGYCALDEDPRDCADREAKEAQKTQKTQKTDRGLDLASRIERAAKAIEKIVDPRQRTEARIDRLRRFVSARLTPAELNEVALRHHEIRVYALWKSTRKKKLIGRSRRVIQVDAAQVSYGALGAGVRWAILDTGIQADHPHFATHGSIVEVWDCTKHGPPKRIAKSTDPDGHGTHVAGIIAGSSKDGTRQGMAPLAKMVIYKVLDEDGAGEDAWIIKALDHIAEQNESSSEIVIHGLNLSLGGAYDATVYGCGFTPICVELRRQWRAGVLVCVASGNEGQVDVVTPDGEVELNSPMSIGDPANLEDCIAIGSVNADRPHLYGISSFSSRGPTSDGRLKPDVVAPGERIESCNSSFSAKNPKTHYRAESGTSMAAPHVSGLLAAFLSVRGEFRGRPDEVKQLLLRTCTDLERDRYHQGHGMPNLMRMLLES